MSEQRPHILYLGEWGFPVGFAAIQRQLLLSRGLVNSGCKVTVLSFKGSHSKEVELPPTGTYQEVDYQYTAGTIYKANGFLKRNYQKLYGRLKELFFILKQGRRGNLEAGVVSTRNFYLLFWYWLIFRLIKKPIILSVVELNSAISSRNKSFINNLNDRLYEKYAYRIVNGCLPISDYLQHLIQEKAPNTKTLKSPIICDFSEALKKKENPNEIKFLYCGSPSYFELIDFVLLSFEQLEINDQIFLDFVLGGKNVDHYNRVVEKVKQHKFASQIRLHRNIPRNELLMHYSTAHALLIPIRPTVQDAARFPHKLGEYLSSETPVITTAYGEINNYDFIDEETALVASAYDIYKFSERMNYVIQHFEEAKEIGIRGRKMGINNFDFKKLGQELKDFIHRL